MMMLMVVMEGQESGFYAGAYAKKVDFFVFVCLWLLI
jgi:hypothetical protein